MRTSAAVLLLTVLAVPAGAQTSGAPAPRKAPRAVTRPHGTNEATQSAHALLQLAREQTARGDVKAAGESLRRALSLAPNSEDVLFAHAQVALSAHAPTQALYGLDALTRMCPAVPQYHYLLGVALMQAGDMTAASEALQRSQELQPDRPLTLIALGFVHNARKRYDEARKVLLRSLELEPENLEAVAALAEAEEGLDDTAEAQSHAQRVLARAPEHPTANLVLGLVLLKPDRYAEAKDALAKAAKSPHGSPKSHYQLSLVYARLGDTVRSQQELAAYQQQKQEVEDRVREIRGLGRAPEGGMQ